MTETETLLYLIDLQIPGIDEKTGQVRALRGELEQMPAKAGEAASGAKDFGEKSKEAAGGAKELTEGIHGGREAISAWTEEAARMGIAIPGLSQGLSGASQAMVGLSTGTLATVGVMAGVGVALSGATAALTAMGAEWQHEQTNIAAAANISVEKAHEIGTAFEALAGQVPQTAMELAQAYAQVAGRLTTYNTEALSAAQATDLMRVASEGAVASGQSLGSTTNALVSAIMSSHSAIGDADRVMDALYVTSRNTNMGLEQVALVAGRLSARMGDAAPDIEGVGIALTLVSQSGISGQRAMMLVTSLLENLAYPSEKAKVDLEALGVEIKKSADGSIIMGETLLSLKSGYDSLSTAAEKHAFAEELGGRNAGILEKMLSGTNDQLHQIIDSYEQHNRVSEDAAKHADDLREMLGKLGAQALVTAQNIGQDLAGALVGAGHTLDTFGQNLEATRREFEAWQRNNASEGTGGRDVLRQQGMQIIVSDYQEQLAAMGKAGDTWARGQAESLQGLRDAHHVWTEAELADIRNLIIARNALNETTAGTRTPSVNQSDLIGQAYADRARTDANTQIDAIRGQQDALSAMGTEGQRVTKIMEDYWKTAGLPEQRISAVRDLTTATNAQAESLERSYGPAAAEKVATLRRLTDDYAAAVKANNNDQIQSAAAALQAFETQLTSDQRGEEQARRTQAAQREAATEAKRAADEIARAQREAAQADVGTGLSQAMAKGLQSADMRSDLAPAAQKVMQDFYAAMAAQGTSGAASAGKSLGDAITSLTDEMQKQGIGDWQETMAAMFDVADAIRRNEPGAVQAFHDLALHAGQEFEAAKIEKAYQAAWEKAEGEVEDGWAKHLGSMQQAEDSAQSSFASTLQTELDRQYDLWAGEQVRELDAVDKSTLEMARLKAQRAQEDSDREESRAQARVDREAQNSRQLSDLSARASESNATAERRYHEARTEATIEHETRLADIRAKGGPGMQASLDSENRTFKESSDKAARAEQVASSERQLQAEQAIADAKRRQAEAGADAEAKNKTQDVEIGKQRERQDTLRGEQQRDQDGLHAANLAHQQAFHIDAESKALARFNADIARIDAKWAHDQAKGDETLELLQAKAAHETALAGLGPEDAEGRSAENSRFRDQSAEITGRYQAQSADIDVGLRGRLQGISSANYAGGFAPTLPGGAPASPALSLGVPASLQDTGNRYASLYAGTAGAAPSSAPSAGAAVTGAAAGAGAGMNDVHVHLHLDGATFIGADHGTAQKLEEMIEPVLLSKIRGQLGAGRIPS